MYHVKKTGDKSGLLREIPLRYAEPPLSVLLVKHPLKGRGMMGRRAKTHRSLRYTG